MPRNPLDQTIKQQLWRAVVSYAIFRWESAVVIAATILLIGASVLDLPWFPGDWWLWLIFGLIGEALIVLTTLRDEQIYQRTMDRLFRQEFDIRKLHARDLRDKLAQALEYRDSVLAEIDRKEDAVLDDYLTDMAHGLEDWIAQVYRLALGLDAYGRDTVIARDMETAPRELAAFEKRLAREPHGAVRQDLEKTVAIKRSQWETLQHLRDTMAKAQLQLENTLSTMSTVYTQVVLLGAKDVSSGRAQRLQQDMAEQIRALADIGTTMDEVYRMSGPG